MCALFAKIVALLAKQFVKQTGCDRRSMALTNRLVDQRDYRVPNNVNRPARGQQYYMRNTLWYM